MDMSIGGGGAGFGLFGEGLVPVWGWLECSVVERSGTQGQVQTFLLKPDR